VLFRSVDPRPQQSLATARTARLRAASPANRATRPHRPCPSRTGTVPPPRSAAIPGRDHRPSLPARPPARFGQPDDTAPRLTRDQRRRVLWATVGIAAALLLASALQHSTSADPPAAGAVACAEGNSTCR